MIYICLPTHNEQQTVGVVLWKLRQVLTEFPRDYQLLVADDASSDKTPQVLEPYTRVLPLTVIRSEERRGYAASLEMLLREAIRRSEYPKRDVIVAMQADFSDEPDDVVALIKRLEAGADVAVGNKVSTTRQPRTRRFARMLSHFFTRRQTWPEGVVTPFDGFRAYRLYAVRRAIEDRNGQRLLRYDGWAGQAELLRAVLPHARRVDVVDVEDRTDRLQRPRRERPVAAALQVRGMVRNVEPRPLIGVEELDQTAATASRSRERATASNGGQYGPAADRPVGRAGEGSRQRHSRDSGGRTGQRPSRAAADADRRPGRPERSGRPDRPDRQPQARAARPSRPPGSEASAPAGPAATGEAGPPEQVGGPAPDAETVGGTPPPKRRKRKRTRGRGAAPAVPEGAVEAGAEPAEAPPAEAGTGEADAAPRKRRRRGGRRGGRGRRERSPGAEAGPGPGEAGAGSQLEPVAVESTPPRAETD